MVIEILLNERDMYTLLLKHEKKRSGCETLDFTSGQLGSTQGSPDLGVRWSNQLSYSALSIVIERAQFGKDLF